MSINYFVSYLYQSKDDQTRKQEKFVVQFASYQSYKNQKSNQITGFDTNQTLTPLNLYDHKTDKMLH